MSKEEDIESNKKEPMSGDELRNLSYREKRNLFLKVKEEKILLAEEGKDKEKLTFREKYQILLKVKKENSPKPKYLNQFHKESTEKSYTNMKIYLDFDGTIVENQYPAVGQCNMGCFEIIDKLEKAGHEIILNTTRVEFNNGTLIEAIKFINHSMANLKNNTQVYSFPNTDHKYEPTKWDWDFHFKTGRIFIDDTCDGIPLKNAISSSGQMVDWDRLDLEFKEHGLYN